MTLYNKDIAVSTKNYETHFNALYRSFSWCVSGGSHSKDANAKATKNKTINI